MSENKHTPGPWMVHPIFQSHVVPAEHVDKRIGGAIDPDKDRKTFAKVIHHARGNPRRFTEDELSANACLIAAAPDLLESLKSCVSELAQLNHECAAGREATHAIAKAYGSDQ